ncbi:tumor necrosis factor ligand superfamily member 10-like [Lingula anatina]|uniref:Tumor necrosis factor ligand superfamily member 10-like n=1 Tax=Lingula anatina TaxID=7574 RepID=A0A1S3HMG9_LINAN|nr:tumor necrosis factor ligand superfamily member 10-like [Lingula anatina]|eukprot:XP_013386234.1 tumor necrosis factor ligand superfamily member 10-like [Lingula anatina]
MATTFNDCEKQDKFDTCDDQSSQSSQKGLLSHDNVKFARSTGAFSGRCVVVLISLLVVFLLVLCALVIYLVFQLRCLRDTREELHWQKSCIPCDAIVSTFKEDSSALGYFQRKEKDGVEYCCGSSAGELTQALKSVVGRNIEEKKSEGEFCRPEHLLKNSTNIPDQKPAAHCVQNPHAPRTPNPGGIKQAVRSWLEEGRGAFTRNGVTYKGGHLTVPHTGFYYVYSQVYFSHEDKNGTNPRKNYDYTQELSHYINRVNSVLGNSRETLLMNLHSKCTNRDDMHFWEHTSYLGAVRHLRQHDEVFVEVSNLTLVEQSPRISYFGLYMV